MGAPLDAGKGGAGEGAFDEKRPPRTPTRKNFGWWGGRTAGVPLRAGPEASGRKSAACRMGRACWGGRPLRPKAVSGRARPLSFYLVDAAEVAAAFKSGVQEQFRDVEGHALAGHALAEAEHVGVVVLASAVSIRPLSTGLFTLIILPSAVTSMAVSADFS